MEEEGKKIKIVEFKVSRLLLLSLSEGC